MNSIDTLSPLQVKSYGDVKASEQILLHVPHAVGGSFIDHHPNFLRYFLPQDRPYIRDYLEVEHDFGSHELAQAIARYLETRLKVRIIITRFTLPRGADDFNRIEEKAIPPIFSENHQEKIEKLLKRKFKEADLAFKKILSNNTSIYAEIHTMGSFCLEHVPKVIRGNLKEVIRGWNDPKNRKNERDICFVSTLLGEGKIADPLLTRYIKTSLDDYFQKAKGAYSDDSPYVADEEKRSHRFMKKAASVCPDIPKHYLSVEQPKNPRYHLAHLTLDREKTNHLGVAIGKGVEAAVKKMKSKNTNAA